MKRIRSIISIIELLAGTASHAGPMGFEGSWMAMGDLGPNWRDLSDKAEITPMLRLVNKRFFIEGGVSNNRDVRFNFMYIF